MRRERPVNLPLPQLFAAMPATAVASILHRASGVALFFGALYPCYLLDLALQGRQGFERAAAVASTGFGKLAMWLLLTALAYHLFAGVRHLLLDLHVGDSAGAGRLSAYLVLLLTAVAAALAGVWLW